jgi:integrase
VDWPRYMVARRLKSGEIAYYWTPRRKDLDQGFPIQGEALGPLYGAAIDRAALLNAHYDSWREGQNAVKDVDLSPRFGTVMWLFERYRRSAAFERVSERSRPEYLRALARIEELPTRTGGTISQLPVASISARAADKIYAALQHGPRGKRVRQANLSVDVARRAWKIVRRHYPNVVPAENPFEGILKITGSRTKVAATRDEAYALAHALKDIGEPHLGAGALICFEWLQRPENVLTGKITWPDYRPPEHPQHVRIFHHKTGAVVLQPLEHKGRRLYPELESYLADLPRVGVPIVVTKGSRGPSRPYAMVYAQAKVREARQRAGLGSHVTLDACRHGGMTELGDAELAEQGVMALSGHKTPHAARLYVKRTERQRINAAAKRRQWIEANETEPRVEMEGGAESRNGTKRSDKIV